MKNKIIFKLIIGLVVWLAMGTIKVEAVTCQQYIGGTPPYKTVTCVMSTSPQVCYSNNSASCCITACLKQISCVNQCVGANKTCYKGDNNDGNCGVDFCSSDKDDCCTSSYGNWTKSMVTCENKSTFLDGFLCNPVWTTSVDCSMGDKVVNPGVDTNLHAGLCNCGLGEAYKYCCDAAGNPEKAIAGGFLTSKDIYQEGTCPGGNGWKIDGDRIRSSPCTPNCVSNCGDTSTVCNGVVYNDNCGAAVCTGTKPLDYSNGACGAPNGQTYSTYDLRSSVAESSLCASGTLVWTDGPGSIGGTDWNWNCVGTTGTCGTGTTANCGAIKNYSGICGSANGQTYETNNLSTVVTKNQLCSSVLKFDDSTWLNPLWEGGPWTDGPGANAPDVSGGPNTWNWVCKGEGAGTNVACSAIKCTTVPPTFGNCGLVGQTFSTTPTTGLCTYGTPSVVTAGTNTYTWTCTGAAGTCPTTSGGATNCSVVRDTGPTFSTMVVQNADGATVVAEDGVRNQICQTTFTNSSNPNLVRFVVTFTDLQGGGDINYAELGIGNKTYTATTFTVNGNNATTTFEVRRSDFTLPTNVLNIYVRAYDDHSANGVTSIAAYTGRDFKFWNCNVPVSGTLFDGSAGTACPSTGFSIPAASTNFQTLVFSNGVGITTPMNIKTANTYGDGNPLVWGKTYTPHFNSDLAMMISGSIKVNNGCTSTIINLENGNIVNPYADSPTLVADFSGIVDQDSWYQTVGGGLMANNLITNRVPVTCITNCAMSVNGTINTNGIVASQLIDNTGGYPVDSVKKGNPNNWWINKNLAETNSEYSELLNQYFWKAGVGETFTGDKNLSEIGTTGVNFVNGNLTVTNDNNVNSGQFLMVVVNGNITVQPNVNNLEGIFVSRNFDIGGSNTTALNFEGMIKTTQNVRVNRTFINKRTNNTAAAVKFVYRPDFIFNIPAAITKQLTKWQWGN